MDTQVIHKPNLSLVPVTPVIQKEVSSIPLVTKKYKQNPFIEANTKSVSLSHLQKDCIIPTHFRLKTKSQDEFSKTKLENRYSSHKIRKVNKLVV